ncbi:unnamed protein product [Adineta ricciae]|uniref:Uncharacterized protein n=1 Tax=Adineta ricciae TaxID=249248 RepID=A0A815SIY0_ADIRI|nr:unnamed protein product [Adineta ricciae]CAF1490399.1 unnamed protein product [Adineta ricciae]
MPTRSQQRAHTDKVRLLGRVNTLTAETSKTTPSILKRDARTTGIQSYDTRTNSCSSSTLETDSNELKSHQSLKIITEVDETNIEDILNLSSISRLPTTFLTEIREDKIYETIYKEIQKKLPFEHVVQIPPVLKLTEQEPPSKQPITIDDDEVFDDDPSFANDVSSPTASDKPHSPSQDGYDTDIESESVISSSRDLTGRTQYRDACLQAKIIPCSYFLAHIQDREMILRYHQFSTEDVRAIAKALSSNICIERLFLDGNYLQQQASKYISDMMVTNDFITELSLADNRLGGGGESIAEICRMLTINRNLKKINLSGNRFNDMDATLLIDAFDHNRTLRELNLSHNCFGEECGKAWGTFISGNETLEIIDLSWNNIRGRSAVDIANGIKENVRLKRCNLEMNGFGPDGGKILADCIHQNGALEELNISSNRLNTQNAFSIAQAILVNDSLRVLKIGNNQINCDGALAIFLCVKANESNILGEVDFSETVVTQEALDTCEDIIKLKDGKFQYRTGKVTPRILQPNSISECYIKTDADYLKKLRTKAANAKAHFS